MTEIRLDISNVAFVRQGLPIPLSEADATVAQDAARSGDLAKYTVMAQQTADGKWVPLTDVAATDGTAKPAGISLTLITEADIKAGDTKAVILVGDFIFDKNQLVLENSLTLATAIGAGVELTTIERELRKLGIYAEDTIDIQSFENA